MKPVSIYQVFPRDFGPHGNLNDVTEQLSHIREMGFDYVYLLPIHPIGIEGRKGTLGSPYAIRNYDAVDPAYGTMEDFMNLIERAHACGLKVMMDIVIHHSACDHPWVKEHPEFYHRDETGRVVRSVPDWSDIYDFDYSSTGLRRELLAMLKRWAEKGVDGFRCDVASLVPLDFWLEARREVAAIDPDFLWLAESVDMPLVRMVRAQGLDAVSDSELCQAFDLLYPYDLRPEWDGAENHGNLLPLQRMLDYTMTEYPRNLSRIWCLENHDCRRIASAVNKESEKNWLAFTFLLPGAAFLYAGEEAYETHLPSLFEAEPVGWKNRSIELEKWIADLNALRKETLRTVWSVQVFPNETGMEFAAFGPEVYYGLFAVNGSTSLKTELKDGSYRNLLNQEVLEVNNHELPASAAPFYARIREEDLEH